MRVIWINNRIDLKTSSSKSVVAEDWYDSSGVGNGWRDDFRIDRSSAVLPIFYNQTKIPKAGLIEDVNRKELIGTESTRTMNDINLFLSSVRAANKELVVFLTKTRTRIRALMPIDSNVHQLIDVVDDSKLPLHYETAENIKRVNVKYCYVNELTTAVSGDVRVVPPVLSTITNNQYITRSTIVELHSTEQPSAEKRNRYAHNVVAFLNHAERMLCDRLDANQMSEIRQAHTQLSKVCDFKEKRWMLLSSSQLETLIAKIFENLGCHVSGYRAGSTEGYDLLVRPMSNALSEAALLPTTSCSPGNPFLVQVKRAYDKAVKTDNHIVHIYGDLPQNVKEGDVVCGPNWISKALDSATTAKKWLIDETQWYRKLDGK